jgi:translation initiation factor 1
VVTVIYDLKLSEDDLKSLAKELRHTCSTGGTIKDGRIELRGDMRDRAVAMLQKLGFKARAAGG